ncbi:MAG: hypothetical protein U0324_44880 [Polyangiales bacterium]
MNGLSPEARDLFARARDADAPAPADRERNRVALQAALGVLLPAGGAIAHGWVAAALPRALAALALATATAVAVAPPPVAPPAAPPAVARPVARPHHAAPRVTNAAPVAPAPVAPIVTPTPAPSVSAPSPRAPLPARRRAVAPPEERVEAPAPAVDAAFAEQLRLLGEAQAALRTGDTQRALAAAAECRRRHPNGALASEAEAVSLLASCASGRAVRDDVARWLAASPRSPLAGRVRRACGVDAP